MNKPSLILLFISIFNPCIWKIFQLNIFLAILLIITSFLLFNLLSKHEFSPKYLIVTIIIFCILSVIGVKLGYDQDLKKLKFYEEIQLDGRNKYYSKELGRLFLNRYSLNYYKNYNPYLYKFQHNFFSVLDPNLYFFSSHPRERPGINEFEKFPSFYSGLFIIGVIYILQFQPLLAIIYFLSAALISGFISPGFELGPILFFPFVVTLTALGVIHLLRQL